jgi:hypothetical protein
MDTIGAGRPERMPLNKATLALIALTVLVACAVTATAARVDRPAPVTNLTGQAKGASAVLTWAPPSYEGSTPVTGYRILKGQTSDNFSLLKDIGLVLTYTDHAVQRGRTYYYHVMALNSAGQSAPAHVVNITIPLKDKANAPAFGTAAVAGVLIVATVAAVALWWRIWTSRRGQAKRGRTKRSR